MKQFGSFRNYMTMVTGYLVMHYSKKENKPIYSHAILFHILIFFNLLGNQCSVVGVLTFQEENRFLRNGIKYQTILIYLLHMVLHLVSCPISLGLLITHGPPLGKYQ